jgi:hypothetical protein
MDTAGYQFLKVTVRDSIAFAEMSHPHYNRTERDDWIKLVADASADHVR